MILLELVCCIQIEGLDVTDDKMEILASSASGCNIVELLAIPHMGISSDYILL